MSHVTIIQVSRTAVALQAGPDRRQVDSLDPLPGGVVA